VKFINEIIQGDCLEQLKNFPSNRIHMCVTSPPYWGLRDYGVLGQLGLEPTLGEYLQKMVEIFEEVKRVLKPRGTLWLNMGDKYNGDAPGSRDADRWPKQSRNDNNPNVGRVPGHKNKDMFGIPWRVAFALQEAGWYLRSDIIWEKPNPMPESVRDRPTKSHEYLFLMSKSARYYYDFEAIKEPIVGDGRTGTGVGFGLGYDKNPKRRFKKTPSGWDTGPGNHDDKKGRYHNAGASPLIDMDGKRNKRSVWTVPTKPCSDAHFATFPEDLIDPCIKAGCPKKGVVLDPFMGSGTTARVAIKNGCKYVGIELNPEYIKLAKRRNAQVDIMELV